MPVKARVTVAPAAGLEPLADYLAGASRDAAAAPALIAVPVRSPDGASPGPVPGAGASSLDGYLGVSAAQVLSSAELTGRAGETTQSVIRLGTEACAVVFLGVGDASPGALRRAGAALARRLPAGRAALTTAVLDEPDEGVQAFTEGILLGSYQFTMKSGGSPAQDPGEVRLLLAGPARRAALVERAVVVAGAVALARDLTNTPSMIKSPEWLAAQAVAVAAEHGLASRVWREAELAAGGFGGILAVGSGSVHPPRLIELSYQPPPDQPARDQPARDDRHVVLIGKGITFDSGGLSLKPNDGMKLMKTDMAGGAAVIGAMSALGRLGARARVTGLVAAAENMPSGTAMRVGDVITHYGGQTVEVLNTDAEGRLVLADALAYADDALAPDLVVDLATLTGAARVALGTSMAALYATDDELATALLDAGTASGDRLWRMPLAGDYRGGLDSLVADLANMARAGGGAGSIDAALFLREFTGGRSWAHLDIAGAARATSDDGDSTKGATGFGTRLLLRWLAASPA
ncbi:MAG TPA: leucyl aminopeptidase [Streptosporangiaceae bacterium]|nr:leucyl aminopeptidase [Streptosporangiaceae bacterium]